MKLEEQPGSRTWRFIAVAALAGTLGLGGSAHGEENASNPLAAVNNTDVRYQYFDLGESERTDAWLDGAYMATPKFKLKYELHYWSTDVTGSSESDWDTLHLKGIYFPKQGAWGAWQYKWAVGLEWINDFDNTNKGIGCGRPPPGDFQCVPVVGAGAGSDQIAPFFGPALVKGSLVIVPLVQHYVEYDGPSVNTTALRAIVIKSLPNALWAKLDLKVPFDWENDLIPATSEMQLGKMMNPSFGLYGDLLLGIGGDRPHEWGLGVGMRFNY
jgi:hypothetical protein